MALKNLKVLDLTRVLAGPYATMLLGDRGAKILKIERPCVGDDTRSWGPPFLSNKSTGEKVSTYYLSVNRNKKSIAIDLKNERGIELVRKLASRCDVLIHNFRQSSIEELKLDYKTLKKINEKLVYCSISGYGDTGRLKNKPAYDVGISSAYCLLSITGERDGDPSKVGVAITDVATGMLACNGILTAIIERNATGLGSYVSTSLMETQLSFLTNIAASALNSEKVPLRHGSAHESLVPYQAFKCSCGNFMFVGCGNDRQFSELLEILSKNCKSWFSLKSRDYWQTNESRVKNRERLVSKLEQTFLTKDREEWLALTADASFVVTSVRNVREAFQCDQVKDRRGVISIDHPIAGEVLLPAHPVKFKASCDDDGEDYDEIAYTPPPCLGLNTAEVLKSELNLSDAEVHDLQAQGVIQCAGADT